jgi:hypothetical protein
VFAAAADIELIGNVRVVTKNAANARAFELTEASARSAAPAASWCSTASRGSTSRG